MAVYDRWHRDPRAGDKPCSCGRGRSRLYPSAAHLRGDRWQVRWRDPATGRQEKKNFALRDGKNPGLHADAYDAQVSARIATRTYVDPKSAEVTLREYAERWRAGRTTSDQNADDIERRLRLHVYEGKPGSGRTPREAVAIGQHPVGLLDARPTMVRDWAAAIPLSAGHARHVMGDVSAVFAALAEDGIVRRDPVHAGIVIWPQVAATTKRAWSLEQVKAQSAELPGRWRIIPWLGAGTGMRQGEMLGLGVDDVDWLKRDDPRVRVVRQLRHVGGEPVFTPLKNRKPHSAPLPESLAGRLRRHLEKYPAVEVTLPWHDPGDKGRHGKPVTVRLMLTGEGRRPVDRHQLQYHWREAGARAGVTPEGERERDDGCHALRHTFVSACLRAGIDVVRVAAWVGDTPAMILKTYAHEIPGGADDDGRAAVDGLLSGPGPSAPDVPSQAADQG